MISDRLRTLRQRNNWSQTDLANKLNITRSSVNAWEMGISVPATKTIVELTSLFHVSADYLLGISNTPEIINLEHYTDREKQIIRELLDYFTEQHGDKEI